MTVPAQTDLAAALGVDPALVTRYKARGMPVDSVEAAAAWKLANVRARAGGRADAAGAPDDAPPVEDYAAHRARREKAAADSAEVRALRESGKVVMLEGAERATYDAFRGLRDAAFQAMRDASPRVRGLTDTREIQLALEGALRTAWQAWEEGARQRLAELAKAARP